MNSISTASYSNYQLKHVGRIDKERGVIMSDYPLRNVPPDLWASVKSRAARDQRSIRSVVIDLLRYYTQHGLPSFQRTEDPHG